ncbi:acyltransferase [Sphingomonas sp. BK235]|uniref:acyltransferase family protein n=1 Tax=Sphingomonas sp. BK235 TaxID=2512131 RepID=UPI0010E565BE|nr:acyltransferase [Sphingomonas sp. BK235]TCP36098.1 peptidoglycan/LPS O-acetylase OafA/YrhL [Sphingomonas sp. BK235]
MIAAGADTCCHGTTTDHILELQSIRGIASLFVVVGHCISFYAAPAWWNLFKHIVNTKAAVEVFFVLSGYVLGRSLYKGDFSRTSLEAYYIKRIARIYPALLVASAVALLYVSLVHFNVPIPAQSQWMSERFRAERFTIIHIAASFLGLLAFLIPPVWTIFVELVASALLPLAGILMANRVVLFWVLVIALVLVSVTVGGSVYYNVDLYLMDFALGAAIVLINPAHILPKVLTTHRMTVVVVLATALLICTRASFNVGPRDRWMHLYESALAALIIFTFAKMGFRSKPLRSRFFVWLGDISYSVYLLHFTVMCLTAAVLQIACPNAISTLGGVVAGLLLSVVTICVVLPLSALMYQKVELPGIRLGKWIARARTVDVTAERAPVARPL